MQQIVHAAKAGSLSLPWVVLAGGLFLAGPMVQPTSAQPTSVQPDTAPPDTAPPDTAPQTPAANRRAEQLKRAFQRVAADYKITIGQGAARKSLSLHDQPIMHWLSLEGTTGTYFGSVFVWTNMQRPEVIGTFFTSQASQATISVCQEVYSFASRQLAVRSGNGKVWHPDPSQAMRPIPDAPIPAKTAQGRRLQIRMMARAFSGRMNRRGVEHALRLLARPVYQYTSDDPEILGGALLVLVAYTTDPDILLLMEARQTAEGPKWFYQPARFSDKSLWLTHRDKDVWISLRQGHGTEAAHAPDRQYKVEFVTVEAPLEADPSDASQTP